MGRARRASARAARTTRASGFFTGTGSARLGFTATGTGLLTAARGFIHRGPGSALGFFFRYAAFLITFFYVFGLALLLLCV